MARSHVLLLSSLTLCAALRAPAQQDGQPARARLFDAPETLPLTLTADFNALSKDRGEAKQEHAGVLAFVGPAGDSVALDVRLRTRGHFRLQRRNCDFPPLKLSFDKQQVKHTVFAGQGGLKLVVHCQDRESYEQNLLQEYLLYRVFNVITPKSFRARLARVTYRTTPGRRSPSRATASSSRTTTPWPGGQERKCSSRRAFLSSTPTSSTRGSRRCSSTSSGIPTSRSVASTTSCSSETAPAPCSPCRTTSTGPA